MDQDGTRQTNNLTSDPQVFSPPQPTASCPLLCDNEPAVLCSRPLTRTEAETHPARMHTGALSLWGSPRPAVRVQVMLAPSWPGAPCFSPFLRPWGRDQRRQSTGVRGTTETQYGLLGRCGGEAQAPHSQHALPELPCACDPWGPEARRSLPLAVFLLSESGVPGSPPLCAEWGDTLPQQRLRGWERQAGATTEAPATCPVLRPHAAVGAGAGCTDAPLLLGERLSLPCRPLGAFARKSALFPRPRNVVNFHPFFSCTVWCFHLTSTPVIACGCERIFLSCPPTCSSARICQAPGRRENVGESCVADSTGDSCRQDEGGRQGQRQEEMARG